MVEGPEVWRQNFEEIYHGSVVRHGSDELFRFLTNSDFFVAPASTKYHLAIQGGLCLHSLNVYNRLCGLLQYQYGSAIPYNGETIAIVALLHDICKVNTYRIGWKNQKTYDPAKIENAAGWQIKHDGGGDFIWETVPAYETDEKFVFGHGEKSVYMIREFMRLDVEEAQAIRFHMGGWRDGDEKWVGACYEKNPLVFYLHVADEAATYIDEVERAE